MLVAHVLTRFLRSGSEENTLITCHAQRADGHDVVIIHGEEKDESFVREVGDGLKFICVPSFTHQLHPLRDIEALIAVTDILRKLSPDVVHTHQSKAGIIGRAAAKLANVKAVIHGVHILPFLNAGAYKSLIYVAAEHAVAPFTDAYISVSKGMMDACIDKKIGALQKHHLVHSGMDLNRFLDPSPPENWRSLLGLDRDAEKPPVLLMLGRLEMRKRHDAFLRVFPTIISRVPNVRLLIAGDGPLRATLEDLAEHLGISSHVRFLGYCRAPEKLIALADLTVLTSSREGLPRVVVQSLAGNTPAAVTYFQGVEEILADGVNGLISPADDIEGLALSIAEALSEPQKLVKLTAGAIHKDVSSWDKDLMCKNIAEIYETVLPTYVTPPGERQEICVRGERRHAKLKGDTHDRDAEDTRNPLHAA